MNVRVLLQTTCLRDSPGGPVVKTVLSLWGAQVQSLVGELRSCKLHGAPGEHAQTIMLNKISQSQQNNYYMTALT